MENKKYKVLLTINLPLALPKGKNDFYESLESRHFKKVGKLTTTWKAQFSEGTTYDKACEFVKKSLSKAEEFSKVHNIEYAFLISENDIESGSI
jgi:hypothetical protein